MKVERIRSHKGRKMPNVKSAIAERLHADIKLDLIITRGPQLPQTLPRTHNQHREGRILGSFGVGVKFNSLFSSYFIFTQ